MTNNDTGTIKASDKIEIIHVFGGEKGQEIVKRLESDEKATFLSILFENYSK